MTNLSDAGATAVAAVDLATSGERRTWFEVLRRTYEDTDQQSGWDAFATALTTAATDAGVASSAVTEFLRIVAEEANPFDVVAELHAADVEVLESTYLASRVPTEPADESYDEAAWVALLHDLGARWDRTDESWDQFRTWFLYEAAQRGLSAPATGFVEYAEGRDKAATFDEYGVPNPAATEQAEEFPEIAVGDSGDWVAYAERLLAEAGY